MTMALTYDRTNDILAVHKGFSADERFKTNICAGDVVVDLSSKERVRGVEILHASRFFSEFGISDLRKVQDVGFDGCVSASGVMLSFTLKTGEGSVPAKVCVPLEEPLLS